MGTNAIPGLSGYDFSSIIEMMVTSYRQPQVTMQTQQTTLQTQQNAWKDVKTRLSALENTLAALKDSDTWTTTKATSSNTDLLNVTGGANGVTGDYNITITQLAQAQTAVSKVFRVDNVTTSLPELTGSKSFTVKGTDGDVTINIAEGSSLKDIQNSINKESSQTGLKASIVQVGEGQYRLALTSTKTGKDNVPAFKDADNFISGFLGIQTVAGENGYYKIDENVQPADPTGPTDGGSGGTTVKAQNAEITVNGLKVTNSSNTITTAIEGVTLNLNAADDTKTVKVTVDEDYSVAQDAVQKFVDQYNSLMSFIAEKANYDATSETAGDLYADPILRGIESRLRTMMGSQWDDADGGTMIFSDLGISTSSDNYGKDATLVFDTTKFQEAMENDIQGVANLFGATYNGITPIEQTERDDAGNIINDADGNPIKAQGLANVLEEYLNPMVKFQGTLDQTNDSYTRQLKDLQDRLDDFEDRATAYEEMIRLKFSRLETALTALNQQSSAFSSMLSSLQSQTSTSTSSN